VLEQPRALGNNAARGEVSVRKWRFRTGFFCTLLTSSARSMRLEKEEKRREEDKG
jgi:hypothetical protein